MIDDLDRPKLTMAEVARRTGRHPCTVYRWIDPGLLVNGERVRLPTRRIGGRRYVFEDVLDAFLESTGEDDPLAIDEPESDRARRRRIDAEAEALVG